MPGKSKLRTVSKLTLACICSALAFSAAATEVRLVGLAQNRAILVIDGGRPSMLRVGQC